MDKSNQQGWIDLQVNGYAGVDFNARGLTVEAVREVTERLAADGTVGYLPTLVTGDPEMLVENIRVIVAARKKHSVCEKGILGFFLEGPFISDKPGAVGTHPTEWVRPPDWNFFSRFQDAAEGMVRMVNVAAEVPGMPDFVRRLSDSGVTVSLGHQLAKSPSDIESCIAAGAKAFTHLGNGIPNEVNRHDNIVFTALVEDRASVMFIPDGHHLPDTMLKLYTRAVPIDRLIAVSDAQYPAGLPPGEYEVCGAHARLEPNGLLWNPSRNCLVGATTPIAKCMEILRTRIGLTTDECRKIGRDNPLRLLGRAACHLIVFAFAALMTFGASAALPKIEDLWPAGKAPYAVAGQSKATIEWFAPTARPNGSCLLIAPGGGYVSCCSDHEGVLPAQNFRARGVYVAVLRYRVPVPSKPSFGYTAFEDAQRAIRLVRSQAKARGFDPEKIGMTGFSAGGHLTCRAALCSQTRSYDPVDDIDKFPCHLNFAFPVYPAYIYKGTAKRGKDADLPLDVDQFAFDEKTPPMCFFHGDDDCFTALGSIRLYERLRKMNVRAELHVVAGVGHGFGGSRPGSHRPSGWELEACNFASTVGMMPFVDYVRWTNPGAADTTDRDEKPCREMDGELYQVVDLSGGPSAASYPVTTLSSVPAGGWTDEYKTSKLVLRRVEPGRFTMGGRSTDYPDGYNWNLHDISLSRGFYVGVFEITQRQWELVMGTRPSCFAKDSCYAARPVECVSFDAIRGGVKGAEWPSASAVDRNSFLGRIRAKTGLRFDLPTEAQWEYACRAGRTTSINTGKNLTATDTTPDMNAAARYWHNGGAKYSQMCDESAGTDKVGSHSPNAWGLYDMHGNVWEWCLDHWADKHSGAIDPVGPTNGFARVLRGGGWTESAGHCRADTRTDACHSSAGNSYGFRISCPAAPSAAPLAAAFANPPRETRPETWFHVIAGNISTNGLRADLETIAKSGYSGIQFFHEDFGGPWPGVEPQTKCLTANWGAYVRFAAEECKRLGLTFKMQNCPGWSMAGGPWITPENAMRDLVFSRKIVDGGVSSLRLERPREADDHPWRDYHDLKVLAFPSPDGDSETCLKPVSVKGPRAYSGDEHFWYTNPWARGPRSPREPKLDGFEMREALMDGFSEKGMSLGYNGAGTEVFEVDFGTNVTVRTVSLTSVQVMNHAQSYEPGVTVRVEAESGGSWRVLRETDMPKSNWEEGWPMSLAIPEATSRRFRLTFVHKHSMYFSFARFYGRAVPDNWEADAAYALRSRLRDPHQPVSQSAVVNAKSVRDLTRNLRADGTLNWKVPPGRWTVLRIGHVNAGHKNSPAPAAATGWECNKLSRSGADAHYDGFIGRLAKGPLAGGLLQGLLLDSWECCSQTWTPHLDAYFRVATGREFPWLMLSGYVVDGREATRDTLACWRRFLSERVASEFYGRIAARAKADGLSVTYQTAGGDVFPGDFLDYWRYADVPMCEYWYPRTKDFVGSPDFKPVMPCASAAHLYGKPRIDAESFTCALTWKERLVDLIDVANWHFAHGVTHNVIQGWIHDPRPDDALPPGGSLGSNGNAFNRRQKWNAHLGEFTAFLARCTLLLERGLPVRDVLLYVGDDVDHVPSTKIPFPEGYKYDYCTPHPFKTRISSKGGAWTTPDGISYGTLWLRDTPHLLPESTAKMSAGIAAGCRVVTNLTAAALPPPDVTGAGRDLVWEHRREGEIDRYFVATDGNRPWKGSLSFRATGVASVWNPQDGSIVPAEVRKVGSRSEVTLSLKPSGCVFVVFDRTGATVPKQSALGSFDFGANCGTWYEELLADEKKPVSERKTWVLNFPHEKPFASKIRVACIGDSITWGSAMTNRVEECYPARLQKLLGDKYVVRNFGDPGTGVYAKPHPDVGGWQPGTWRDGEQAKAAYEFEPDIVIANFGINDVGNHDDELKGGSNGRPFAQRGTFVRDYTELLKAFRKNGKSPKFAIWTRLAPVGKKHCLFNRPWAKEMEPDLSRVAEEVGAAKIDMYTPLKPMIDTPHFASDAIHPEGEAQKIIAEKTYECIR